MENCGLKTAWFLVLIFIALSVASFCASCYILVHPISVCLPGLEQFLPLLMKGLQFPHYCAERMMGVPVRSEHDVQHQHTTISPQATLDY